MICRTIHRNLDNGLDVTAPESLPRNPKPMTGHQLCRLANDKRLGMIKRGCLVVGQSHGERLGLICGQRCTLPRTLAADKTKCQYEDKGYFHKVCGEPPNDKS